MIKQLKKEESRQFYRQLLTLAIPAALQQLVMASLNLVDNVMIGQLGEQSVAAIAVANQVFFLMFLVFFGISSGTGVFIAQYWGKKDISNIRRSLGLCLCMVCAVATIFFLPSILFPKHIVSIFTKDPEVIELGVKYLVIIAFSFIFTAISFSYSVAQKNIERMRTPLIISAISLGINTVLNYILIFGKLGAPKLGVEGAAIATLIARIIEMFLYFIIIYLYKGPKENVSINPAAASLKEMMDFSSDLVKRFIKIALPVVANEFFWALGIMSYKIVFGYMGTETLAAVSIAENVTRLLRCSFFGIAGATAVIIGKNIGEGSIDKAWIFTKKIIRFNFFGSLLIAVCLFTLAPLMLTFFKVSELATQNAIMIMRIDSFIMPIKLFNLLLIVGLLRSGGDTRFSMMLEAGAVWFIGVPLCFLSGMFLNLPLLIVMIAVSTEEIFKAIIGIKRIISRKWIKDVTV
jgi:putative MATE family efflux protein